ncbi:hypothetical protein [Novosphingobium sp. TH158]|uniref:hypothetical protein n=1 Tax=Novosphingobium sp. TH158 TaxID=2067455 RepID=UPI000C79940C|nr:hypothetical protein [Novosphingobium sp. TH158]PLK25950.1 hypothetical protein C0V78_02880 [Novosphingobium sp. TH158]
MASKNSNSSKTSNAAGSQSSPSADFSVEPIAGEGLSASGAGSTSGGGSADRRTGSSRVEGFIDRQLGVIAEDLESFAAVLADATTRDDQHMGQGLRSTIEPLSGKIEQFAGVLRDQEAHRLVERTRELVVRHPMAIVGGAAVVAAALGQLAVMASRRADMSQPG